MNIGLLLNFGPLSEGFSFVWFLDCSIGTEAEVEDDDDDKIEPDSSEAEDHDQDDTEVTEVEYIIPFSVSVSVFKIIFCESAIGISARPIFF